MVSFSTITIHPTNNPASSPALSDAITKARELIKRGGDIHAAIRNLPDIIKSDRHAFHDAILNLLDSSPSPVRQKLIKETLSQHPNFNLNALNKEGKTVLDLAVRHGDQEFARYLLGKGAKPEQPSLSSASNEMQVLLTSWRRKNLLYPHPNERNSLTPLEHLLLEGRHEEVREQLESILPKYENVPKFWAGMMEGGMHDILRAFLVVATPGELRELTKEKHVVGQWIKELKGKELHSEPRLSTVLTEFPYQSAERGKPENLNGVAKFTDIDVDILCRHLATHHQVRRANNSRLKFDYTEFSSEKKIARNVKWGIEKTYRTLKALASETHLIDNKKFGQFLARQFEAMEKVGKQSKMMLVESTNHTMDFTLMIKEKDDKKSYVATFFDPNETDTHTRSKAYSVQTFETQTMESYITDADEMKGNYPEHVGMSIIFVHPEANTQISSTTTHGSNMGRTLTSMDIKDIDATVMWHLISEGFAGNLRKLHDHFSLLPEDKRIELLGATNDMGCPAFYASIGHGNVEVAEAYGDLVKLVSPDRQVDLLLPKISNSQFEGRRSLQLALESNHFKVINVLLHLLTQIAPDLSTEKRAELREELKDYEKAIGKPNHSLLTIFRTDNERSKMQQLFVELKTELEG